MDPLLTIDGRPYGPTRYKEIVKERYLVAKHCNTSYVDVGEMTPAERQYLIEFITEDAKKAKEHIEQQKQSNNR